MLFWRLTREHTPHVKAKYADLGLSLPMPPHDSIDSETLPFPGIVGGILSLTELADALRRLESELDELAVKNRRRGQPSAGSAGPPSTGVREHRA